jgi:RHS repeat-associated protein
LAHNVYDSQGRLMGEYLASATDVKGEYIYLSPDGANDNQSPFGGDDGMGGYGLLAVATKDAGNNPVIHWIHSNHLGAPMVTTDNSGIGIAPGSYTQAVFPGQMRTHADLYYNRYRDYDPTTGRYIQADPIGLAGGSNPYLYANDNPMRYTDPTGEFVPLLVIGGRLALQCAVNPACRTAVVAGGAAAAAAIYNWSNNSPLNPAPLPVPASPSFSIVGSYCPQGFSSDSGAASASNRNDDNDCALFVQQITEARDELAKRTQEYRKDLHGLPIGPGPMTRMGHVVQFQGWQSRLRRLLNQAIIKGCNGYPSDAWYFASKVL